ncbi:putative Mg(2+) transporter MNR2 Ecym_2298 [Eremothecium cymbalariae DBVPG|uniref:Manganese resistance protein MNR2 n=1 Tax=Eremothecium cymbalariae (strain CBS 270.75 / DBVPG 7215 / KCTC 17166 / NRRL Y-17582) TaxID=931890 RepID=G8JQ38_ERECY|nr:Hypothetical protein Ecym_2298 [Eremothecium cymbalariae DBVPG\
MSRDKYSEDLDAVPLLIEDVKAGTRHTKKRKRSRRRSVFQNNSSDDHHDIIGGCDESFAPDFDKTDSWGVIHDTDDDSSVACIEGRQGSNELGESYIDHRPLIAVREAAQWMHNGVSGGSNAVVVRPSTVPKGGASEVPVSGGSQHHEAMSNPKFRDPFIVRSEEEGMSEHRKTAQNTQKEAERWAISQGYGSMSSYPGGTSRRASAVRGLRGDVVIDMDELLEHVKLRRDQESRQEQQTRSTVSEESEEYKSQPSSRRSSGSSSLDDVCLPIDEDDAGGLREWPDVSVLEEFSKEEIEKLKREALRDAEDFHFQYDDEDEDDTTESFNGIAFLRPIITNIDVPELGNTRINEAEQLRKGRLRPKKLTPWHLKKGSINLPGLTTSGKRTGRDRSTDVVSDDLLAGRNIQYPPHIISNNPEIFRFTYFREDLDSTIHSPTISGLLQPDQKFEELFVSSIYANGGSGRVSEGNNHTNNNITNHTSSTNNLHTATWSGNALDQITPLDTKASTPLQQTSTTQQSGSWDLNDALPFWLDVLNPTEEEMKVLSKAFGIHPLTTEDIFLGEVREKVELFKDYYLVCFRSFDIVAERSSRKRKRRQQQQTQQVQQQLQDSVHSGMDASSDSDGDRQGWFSRFRGLRRRSSTINKNAGSSTSSYHRRLRKIEENEKYKRKSGDRRKPRDGELEPLNVYIIVFRTGVLTFHFAPTPHPINVRRRARLLKDYLNVTADWIAYALIDDITDAFAPMIELIEDEVYDIEDSILKMHQADDSSDSSDSDLDGESSSDDASFPFDRISRRTAYTHASRSTATSRSSSSTESTINAKVMGWKKKGDMLRRIGECRKRVMSIVRLLGSKADVIKGFSKRCTEQWEVAPRSEIGMYLGDIQDHIITMVSSLNHYEKLLSRSHSNYLAQINIDMTKVSNDMNDVLGKITILGTIVMPMNIITGLWGMNVIVPGQSSQSLMWFVSITLSMVVLAFIAYTYTRRRFGF